MNVDLLCQNDIEGRSNYRELLRRVVLRLKKERISTCVVSVG